MNYHNQKQRVINDFSCAKGIFLHYETLQNAGPRKQPLMLVSHKARMKVSNKPAFLESQSYVFKDRMKTCTTTNGEIGYGMSIMVFLMDICTYKRFVALWLRAHTKIKCVPGT